MKAMPEATPRQQKCLRCSGHRGYRLGGRTDPDPRVCNWGMHDGRANFAGVQPTRVFLGGGFWMGVYGPCTPVGVFSAHKSQADRPLGAIASRCEYITLDPGAQTSEPRAEGIPFLAR